MSKMVRKITDAQKKYGPKVGIPMGKSRIVPYPEVLSEMETLRRVAEGASLARFGDGELRIARNGTSITQRDVSDRLRREVRDVLNSEDLLVGIPNICSPTPKQMYWHKYATEDYVELFKRGLYASTWITRSDEAPWINTAEYWDLMRSLWRGRDVTLVLGTNRSLRPEDVRAEAKSVKEVWGPRAEAYQEINRIETEILDGPASATSPVLMCLGVTATVLAARLARRGIWAVDLGHVGMFMRRSKVLPVQTQSLISDKYVATLREMHAREPWGLSGWKYVADVFEFYREMDCKSLLDYGSGSETLARDLSKIAPHIEVEMYDPGVAERSMLPEPADLVVCTDVMEHIEPDKVEAVLEHIFGLARKGVYFVISLGGSKQDLPDGRNAHILVRDKDWWLAYMKKWEKLWTITRVQDRGTKCIALWIKKTFPSSSLNEPANILKNSEEGSAI